MYCSNTEPRLEFPCSKRGIYITEIMLKVALNTINQTKRFMRGPIASPIPYYLNKCHHVVTQYIEKSFQSFINLICFFIITTSSCIVVTQNPGWNSPALSVEFEIGDGEQALVNVPGKNNKRVIE
jgi:hypothetical protein